MKSQNHRTRSIVFILALALTLFLPSVQAAPGDLDTSFNPPLGFTGLADAQFYDVAIQPDGKILAAGQRIASGGGNSSLIVARFNPDGSGDAGFGIGGVAIDPAALQAISLALQPDGKVVAFGHTADGDFFVTRFNTNGTPDAAFGQGGSTTIDFGGAEIGSGVSLGPGGTIVVSGIRLIDAPFDARIAVARLLSNGSLDPAFGTGGKVSTEAGFGGDLAVQTDGRVIVVSPFATDFVVFRYNSNGSLDLSFGGGDGIAIVDFFGGADASASLGVQSDGRIVLVGNAEVIPGQFAEALARLDSNGNLDPSFDGDGRVTGTTTGIQQSVNAATGVAFQADGGIVTIGLMRFGLGFNDARALVSRYLPNGSPDPAFGTDGTVSTDFPGFSNGYSGVAIQSDGKIVITGDFDPVDPEQGLGLVARYLGNGSPPPPPPPPAFDFCVQKGSFVFRFNSTTGAYEFRDCSKNYLLTGTGTITVNFCKMDLVDTGPNPNHPDRDILVKVNTCTKSGSVSVRTYSPLKTWGYTDSDVTVGSCICP